jgi:uncharacterized protein YjbI with pentapeptide repeats
MAEYTTRQILDMIEALGMPKRLDLSGRDLTGIDLSRDAVHKELEATRRQNPQASPPWWFEYTKGITLSGVNLRDAVLMYANLEGVDLTRADLRGADLTGADLEGATLWRANLAGADLNRAKLTGANLGSANLERAHLRSANLEASSLKGASLCRADLSDASLEKAELKFANLEEANLSLATLRDADLLDAKLRGVELARAALEATNLQGAELARVNLLEVENLTGVRLYGALLDHTRVAGDQLEGPIGEELNGEWRKAKEAYLALKTNFEQLGRYDDARWAYRKERRMEKREAWQSAGKAAAARSWREVVGSGAKAVSDQLVELVCDYGESISRVFLTLLSVWLFFAVVYALIGVRPSWQEGSAAGGGYSASDLLYPVIFSLRAMTRFGAAGFETRPALAIQVLASIQALLGAVLAGLFGFVLGNRIRR